MKVLFHIELFFFLSLTENDRLASKRSISFMSKEKQIKYSCERRKFLIFLKDELQYFLYCKNQCIFQTKMKLLTSC